MNAETIERVEQFLVGVTAIGIAIFVIFWILEDWVLNSKWGVGMHFSGRIFLAFFATIMGVLGVMKVVVSITQGVAQ